MLEKLVHLVVAVFFLHDAECGVLGQRLGHHVGAFHPAADELMCPPLVRQLVSGDEIGVVDVLWTDDARDEPVLLVGDGVGEGLGKLTVPREFQNAELPKLEGAEILFVVSQAGFGGVDHPLHVVGVCRRGVDFDVHRARCARVHLALDVVFPRDIGHEVQNRDLAHGVVDVVAPGLVPVPRGVPGRQGDLVVCGADHRVERHPVGLRREEAGSRAYRVTARRQVRHRAEVLVTTSARVGQLAV